MLYSKSFIYVNNFFSVTNAQSSCPSFQHLFETLRPAECSAFTNCVGFSCFGDDSIIVRAKRCTDPVEISVNYGFTDDNGNEHTFRHTFNKSETVGNDGNGDTGRYTAVMSRNISHVRFEVQWLISLCISMLSLDS